MKKTLLLAAVAIVAAAAPAQELADRLKKNPKTGLVTFERIIEVPNKNKEQLYHDCHVWTARLYNNANVVVQIADEKRGEIIAKPLAEFYFLKVAKAAAYYALTIQTKDGKVRATIDLIHSDHTPDHPSIAGWGVAEEWLDGYASGIKQPKESLLRLNAMANALADHLENILDSLQLYVLTAETTENW